MRNRETAAIVMLSVALVLCGCSSKEHETAAATGSPAATTSTGTKASHITVTDDELNRFLEWVRQDQIQTDRHAQENREIVNKIDSNTDPAYAAMVERQRKEMEAMKNAMPVSEEKARALVQTIQGIGGWRADESQIEVRSVFVPGHSERLLAQARQKYGDEFVDWVLSRESRIVQTLTR